VFNCGIFKAFNIYPVPPGKHVEIAVTILIFTFISLMKFTNPVFVSIAGLST
jgi:hypothetical protein